MSKNNGGPAFPQLNRWDKDTLTMDPSGMTLRDYFAAVALQGLCVLFSDYRAREMMILNAAANGLTAKAQVAHAAYEYADEMLAERAL